MTLPSTQSGCASTTFGDDTERSTEETPYVDVERHVRSGHDSVLQGMVYRTWIPSRRRA